jgi:septal ring factor EnvC (AmiA/AmiB activator)
MSLSTTSSHLISHPFPKKKEKSICHFLKSILTCFFLLFFYIFVLLFLSLYSKIKRLEIQLKEARGTMEKQVQAMDTLFGKTQKLAEDLDTQMIANDGVTKELHRVEGELKKRDTEIINLINDNNGIKRRVDKEKKNVVKMQQKVCFFY